MGWGVGRITARQKEGVLVNFDDAALAAAAPLPPIAVEQPDRDVLRMGCEYGVKGCEKRVNRVAVEQAGRDVLRMERMNRA